MCWGMCAASSMTPPAPSFHKVVKPSVQCVFLGWQGLGCVQELELREGFGPLLGGSGGGPKGAEGNWGVWPCLPLGAAEVPVPLQSM